MTTTFLAWPWVRMEIIIYYQVVVPGEILLRCTVPPQEEAVSN